MSENEKRNAVIVLTGIAAIQLVHAFRIRRLNAEVAALRADFLDYIEQEYQEVVDEEFDEIVTNYGED